MKLLIGSNNKGKVLEISAILKDTGWNTLGLSDLDQEFVDVEETGTTYEENAMLKARYFAKESGLYCVADDSGIIVNAMKDELGVYTRRWGAGDKATDQEWIEYFLKRMENEEDRTAEFISTAVLVDPSGNKIYGAVGRTKGVLLKELKAPIVKGIPISSIFVADGQDKVYSQLTMEEKGKISHRGKAFRQIKEFLMNYTP